MIRKLVLFFLITFMTWSQSIHADIAQQRFALPGSGAGFSSVLVGDLDNNLGNGNEIVKATTDGRIHALNSSGQILLSSSIPKPECVGPVGNRLHSTPALGVLDKSGRKAIVIGFGGIVTRSCDGGVLALDATTGSQLWFFSLKQFSKANKFYAFRYSTFSTPALSEVNKDGVMEIAFGAFDRNVYLLNPNGKVRWFYNAADTVCPPQCS
jgi:outer membrane protein assembly factor BamB